MRSNVSTLANWEPARKALKRRVSDFNGRRRFRIIASVLFQIDSARNPRRNRALMGVCRDLLEKPKREIGLN